MNNEYLSRYANEFEIFYIELFQILIIMRAFSADKFRSYPRRQNGGLTNTVVFKPYGDCHLFKVHTYHCKAYVKPCVGTDFFECDRFFEGIVRRSRK